MGAPPTPDPIETRLLRVPEMLDQAVREVHRVMAQIRGEPLPPPKPSDQARSTDGNQ